LRSCQLILRFVFHNIAAVRHAALEAVGRLVEHLKVMTASTTSDMSAVLGLVAWSVWTGALFAASDADSVVALNW
jgi:hypothetical protein